MLGLRQILGHQTAIALLERMLATDRIPHAQLFQGPEGVGKASTALAFAHTLLCEASAAIRPCGACAACRLLRAGSHPDLTRVDLLARGETQAGGAAPADAEELRKVILVDQIRDLSRLAGMGPRMGRRRVFLIDPADQMMLAAQNALLKTLEEPPGNALLLLVASRPHLLVPTVRSRCFQLRFGAARVLDLAQALRGTGMADDEAVTRAALAAGRAGRAIALDVESLRERREGLLESLEALTATRPGVERLPALVALLGGTHESSLIAGLELMQALLRDAARAAVRPEAGSLIHADLAPRLTRLGQRLGPERASALVGSVDRLRSDLRFNVNRTLVAESLLVAVAGGPLP